MRHANDLSGVATVALMASQHIQVPAGVIVVAALLALTALLVRLWYERRALLLVKLPAYLWLTVVYVIVTFEVFPGLTTADRLNALKGATFFLLLAVAFVDTVAAMRLGRMIRRSKRDGL
jgi:hypothetical protein